MKKYTIQIIIVILLIFLTAMSFDFLLSDSNDMVNSKIEDDNDFQLKEEGFILEDKNQFKIERNYESK